MYDIDFISYVRYLFNHTYDWRHKMFDILRKVLPFKGHKSLGVFHKFEAACECGWYSCPHQTRREAYSEWRTHVLDCGGQLESFDKARARRDREVAKALKCGEVRP